MPPTFPYMGHLRQTASYSWNATDLARSVTFFVADGPVIVRSIKVRVDIAATNASAVTAVVRKVPAGTVLTAGTIIHAGTANLKGTAHSVAQLALTATATDWTLAENDALVFHLTGISTAAQGCVTVGMEAASQ